MAPIGFNSAITSGVAASMSGSLAGGATERAARVESVGHALAVGEVDLSPNPLSGDPDTSADRDADGWTGDGTEPDPADAVPRPTNESPSPPIPRRRLPDDPRGGRLDVIV